MSHRTQGIIATPRFWVRGYRRIFFLSRTICHVVIDELSCTFGAGFVVFRRRERRRSGRYRKRSLLVRAFIARAFASFGRSSPANRPVRRRQLLLLRRVEWPRLVSVRRRVQRWFWLDRPLQHLWRLGDPAPSPPGRSRFPSPRAEPSLLPPRAASAPRRGRRSGVSYFRRQLSLASLWRRRCSRLA